MTTCCFCLCTHKLRIYGTCRAELPARWRHHKVQEVRLRLYGLLYRFTHLFLITTTFGRALYLCLRRFTFPEATFHFPRERWLWRSHEGEGGANGDVGSFPVPARFEVSGLWGIPPRSPLTRAGPTAPVGGIEGHSQVCHRCASFSRVSVERFVTLIPQQPWQSHFWREVE